ANAASPVALMLLGAEVDDIVTIEAAGPSAAEAVDKIAAVLAGAEAAKPAAKPVAAAPAAVKTAVAPLAAGAALEFDGVTASGGLAVGTS
ncbi:HPr family phosphocarrier protein, partial [Mycobacterium tuberculosis]|nr:HPr family phosphocarrier protein [Mycobacterium tuberculosis]